MLERLALQVGATLRIGHADYRIVDTLTAEPDRLDFNLSLGPRVLLSAEGLRRTGLFEARSRVEYIALLRLPPGATGRDADLVAYYLRRQLPNSTYYRVETFSQAQPAVRSGIRRIGRFLGFVSLLSLLIGGVGVAQTMRSWIATRTTTIAIYKCLGMRPRDITWLYLVQMIQLALLGSLVGAAIGLVTQWSLPMLLSHVLPTELVRWWQPIAVLKGVGLAVVVSLVFAGGPLLAARRVPAVRIFLVRDNASRRGWERVVLGTVTIGVLFAVAVAQSESARDAAIFTGGLVVLTAILAATARGLGFVVGGWSRRALRGAAGVWLRHGLAALARPGAATTGSMVALGLGVTVVLAVHLVQAQLGDELSGEIPTDAPSTFLIDIQPDQWAGVRTLLEQRGAREVRSVPVIAARVKAIDGVAAETILKQSRAGERPKDEQPWALTRQQRLTYAAELPKGNRIDADELWREPGVDEISVEQSFARGLGVDVGSVLTLDIQGVAIDLKVTSLRDVNWRTFGINFFLLVEPGVLEDAPQMRLATAQLPAPQQQQIQDALTEAYPNVTAVHIRAVLDKVLGLLGRLGIAVRALGGFAVFTGLIILGGALSATYARRGREVALYKTLGMTRRDVLAIFTVEFALLGIVASIIGAAAASVLGWATMTHVLEVEWQPRSLDLVVAVAVSSLLTVSVGWLVSVGSLATRPMRVLRSE